jgi:serine/threonine protein kinase
MPDAEPDKDDVYPLVGETLGMWRLVQGLGKGGMGEVYAAEYDYAHLLTLRLDGAKREVVRREVEALSRQQQARLAAEILGTQVPADAQFAIKVCNARVGTSGHRRFLQEADVAQKLGDHPYIVTVHAVHTGQSDNGLVSRLEMGQNRHREVAYMVMDLATRDYRHDRLTTDQAVHIVRCIANALDHAHAKGVVHRDLKPENILGSVEHPLLTDFGIAKDSDHSEGLTRTGQIIGTLDYMSPEQATDAKRVDQRSDVYSLGVVLYEMSTQGRLPYAHKQDRESCLAAIRSERTEPKWPREHVAEFPVHLERIVLKAMAHRQEERYQSMAELIADLDRYARGEWIPFWGRVRVKSWLRFCIRAYPKALWSAVAMAIVVAGLLLYVWVPRIFDPQRTLWSNQLSSLERSLRDIGPQGAQRQLGRDERKSLGELRGNLARSGAYADLARRLDAIQRGILERSSLVAWFRQVPGRPRMPYAAAQAELRVAAGEEQTPWVSDERYGLMVRDYQTLRLGPFGLGGVRALVWAFLPPGVEDRFRMEVREADDPRHVTAWTVTPDRSLQLIWREDLRPPVRLRQERLDASGLVQLEITANALGVVSQVRDNDALRHPYAGLREGAPAVVELVLPKGTYVWGIEVVPVK